MKARLAVFVAEYPLVVLDLTHVEFFDLSCLNTVLSAHKRSLANGHRLVLQLGDKADTRRLLELAGTTT